MGTESQVSIGVTGWDCGCLKRAFPRQPDPLSGLPAVEGPRVLAEGPRWSGWKESTFPVNRQCFPGDEKELVTSSPLKETGGGLWAQSPTAKDPGSCKKAGVVCQKEALAMQGTGREKSEQCVLSREQWASSSGFPAPSLGRT